MTCVAFPLGRGRVFSGNSNVSVALRLIELRYLPKLTCPDAGGPSGPSAGRIQGCRIDELLVCLVIRWTTEASSSASKRENKTRCNVWQLTHPPSWSFCSGVPGTLINNSPFDICMATLVGLVTLFSFKSNGVACA